jgi:hypothetical protein
MINDILVARVVYCCFSGLFVLLASHNFAYILFFHLILYCLLHLPRLLGIKMYFKSYATLLYTVVLKLATAI